MTTNEAKTDLTGVGGLGASRNKFHIKLAERNQQARKKILIDMLFTEFGIDKKKIEKVLDFFDIQPKWNA